MADSIVRNVLSVCATTSNRLPDLTVKNGNLIFVQDKCRIAFDFNDKRVFYNQITELESDAERLSISAPVNGSYYFVIDTAVLWTYQDGWVQLTTPPEDIVFIGTELPELGQNEKTLYVNKEEKEISVWDEEDGYTVVSDKTESISKPEIDLLFA